MPSVSTPTPVPHPLPASSEQIFYSNLQDLLQLHESGESVLWPTGFDARSARALISQGLLPPLLVNPHAPVPLQPSPHGVEKEGINASACSGQDKEGFNIPPPPDPNSICPMAKRNPTKFTVTPRVRRFVNLKEYGKFKAGANAEGSGAASSSGAVTQSHFDDPDASFSEGSLSEGED